MYLLWLYVFQAVFALSWQALFRWPADREFKSVENLGRYEDSLMDSTMCVSYTAGVQGVKPKKSLVLFN